MLADWRTLLAASSALGHDREASHLRRCHKAALPEVDLDPSWSNQRQTLMGWHWIEELWRLQIVKIVCLHDYSSSFRCKSTVSSEWKSSYCWRNEVKTPDERRKVKEDLTTIKEEVGMKMSEKGSWSERCIKTEGCDCLEREDICTNP